MILGHHQLADLPRKSVQPIADFNGTLRRTLQEFLDCSPGSPAGLRDRVQQVVARDHADPRPSSSLTIPAIPNPASRPPATNATGPGAGGRPPMC